MMLDLKAGLTGVGSHITYKYFLALKIKSRLKLG